MLDYHCVPCICRYGTWRHHPLASATDTNALFLIKINRCAKRNKPVYSIHIIEFETKGECTAGWNGCSRQGIVERSVKRLAERLGGGTGFRSHSIVLARYPKQQPAIEVWLNDLVRRNDDNLTRAFTQCRIGRDDVLDVAVARTGGSLGDHLQRGRGTGSG